MSTGGAAQNQLQRQQSCRAAAFGCCGCAAPLILNIPVFKLHYLKNERLSITESRSYHLNLSGSF